MSYSIFLDGKKLPVSTDKISRRREQEGKEYDLLGVGKVQVPGRQGLTSIEFKTELPAREYGYVDKSSWEEPGKILRRLQSLQERKTPFQFVAVGDSEKLTLSMTLENLSVEELATEDGDYTISLSLKEYRSYGAVATDMPVLPRPGCVSKKEMVAVKAGQTLDGVLQEAGYDPDKLTAAMKLAMVVYPPKFNPVTVEEGDMIYLANGEALWPAAGTELNMATYKNPTEYGSLLSITKHVDSVRQGIKRKVSKK